MTAAPRSRPEFLPETLLDMARALTAPAREAARAILEVYATDFTVQTKADASPVTRADKASDALLRAALTRLYPEIPILSEETAQEPYEVRRNWGRFFLVDPLDGTKEFVHRNDEFTVNIGYVEGTAPALGLILIPVSGVAYFGGPGLGAFRLPAGADPAQEAQPIACAAPEPGRAVMVASRSHPSPELARYARDNGIADVRPAGAAAKFCRLAEGLAHVYPRYNPTMEWDTAAGQAILEGAGGSMTRWDGSPFSYNKPSLKNGGFIARCG